MCVFFFFFFGFRGVKLLSFPPVGPPSFFLLLPPVKTPSLPPAIYRHFACWFARLEPPSFMHSSTIPAPCARPPLLPCRSKEQRPAKRQHAGKKKAPSPPPHEKRKPSPPRQPPTQKEREIKAAPSPCRAAGAWRPAPHSRLSLAG